MSAFAIGIGGKADIAFAAHMSAYDPKRTWVSGNKLGTTVKPQ